MLFRFKYSFLFIFVIYISSFSQSFAATKVWYVIDAVLMVETAQQACEILEARIAPGTLGEILIYELGSVANEQVAACELGKEGDQKFHPVTGRRESYHLFQPQQSNNLSCTVGNPIDPVSGNKVQVEGVINLQGINDIAFNLYYDSQVKKGWSHEYNKTASYSFNDEDEIEYNFNNTHILDAVFVTTGETLLNLEPTGITPRGKLPQSTGASNTPEAACANWINFKHNYSYDWIASSTYNYIGNGKCEIRANNQTKLILDVYNYSMGTTLYESISTDPLLPESVTFSRQNGALLSFEKIPGSAAYTNQTNSGETFSIINNGTEITHFTLLTGDNSIEHYDVDPLLKTARLVSIEYINGNVLSLTYDGLNLLDRATASTGDYLDFGYESYGASGVDQRLNTVQDKQGRSWNFSYNVFNNIEFIHHPDTTYRKFIYGELGNSLGLLIGIEDENRNNYAHWDYDNEHRAILSAHGTSQDIDKRTLHYVNGSTVNVADIRTAVSGAITTVEHEYRTNVSSNKPLVSQITRTNCVGCENANMISSHDSLTGRLESVEDKGKRTEYLNYDDKGNPGVIKEAVGTPEQREKTYTYDARYHSKVATITEASVFPGNQKVTTYTYDDFGNNTAITVVGFTHDGLGVNQFTTFEYNGPYHQLTRIDGPRGDVSDIATIDYYPDDALQGNNRARMKRVTSAENITLYDNITYTATGKLQSYLEANNGQTTLDYYLGNDRLQRLDQTDLNTGEQRITRWSYLATGEVKTITTGSLLADEVTLTLNYDDARRLTSIVDGLGNVMEYMLDSEGNVEQENIRDATGALKKQLTQTFDDYNRLQLSTQVNEQLTETWLANGTLDKIVDGKNVTIDYSYDNLKRLTHINQDMAGTSPQTADALTILNYDVQDNLTSVKNALDGTTIYSYDDLGNQLSRSSPDTGLTTYDYDGAGNIISMTDANNEMTNYHYDGLNRLTLIQTSNANDDYQFEYDNCKNGAARLCKVSNKTSAQHYQYDAFGNVAAQQALQYTYDTADRLKTVTYPSSAIVHYDYDAAGQVQQVSLERNGSIVPLANNITYEPFGDFNNLFYGNGLTLTQSKDTAYRPLTQSILDVFELNYTLYDANGNLKQRDDTVSNTSAVFAYDAHDRLNSATGDFGVRSYTYDKNANRESVTADSVTTVSDYQPVSNRLSMRGVDNAVLDNNGNMLALGDRNYSYNKHNRLFEVFDNGVLKATYQYNGLGQRISKTRPGGGGKYFIYDTDGKLMAETDINGNILFEYIYLNGELLAKYTPDTDSDGISNFEEDKAGTNPVLPDSDSDGLSDLDEMFIHGTSINNADSDDDGVSDSAEIAFNSNPLNSSESIGDINLNGEFNLGDYVLLTQFVLDLRVPNATEFQQADINKDGVVNIQDMLMMQRVLLGLQVSWFDFSTENIENLFAQIYQTIIPLAYAANGDGDIYYVHNDHLGAPVKMTNAIGIVVWQATYDPFGKATVDKDVDLDGNTIEMNVRFPGQYYDVESGLHYNYFRYYDPELGRYITSDPIGLFGGVNTYAYAGGNPLKYIDPNGNAALVFGGTVVAGLTAYGVYLFTRDVDKARGRIDNANNDMQTLIDMDRGIYNGAVPDAQQSQLDSYGAIKDATISGAAVPGTLFSGDLPACSN